MYSQLCLLYGDERYTYAQIFSGPITRSSGSCFLCGPAIFVSSSITVLTI